MVDHLAVGSLISVRSFQGSYGAGWRVLSDCDRRLVSAEDRGVIVDVFD